MRRVNETPRVTTHDCSGQLQGMRAIGGSATKPPNEGRTEPHSGIRIGIQIPFQLRTGHSVSPPAMPWDTREQELGNVNAKASGQSLFALLLCKHSTNFHQPGGRGCRTL